MVKGKQEDITIKLESIALQKILTRLDKMEHNVKESNQNKSGLLTDVIAIRNERDIVQQHLNNIHELTQSIIHHLGLEYEDLTNYAALSN
jgi:hypothetical protein